MRTTPLFLSLTLAALLGGSLVRAETISDPPQYPADVELVNPLDFGKSIRAISAAAKAQPRSQMAGFIKSPPRLKPSVSRDFLPFVKVRYLLAGEAPGGMATFTAAQQLRLAKDFQAALEAEGLPVAFITTDKDGSGTVVFRSPKLAKIHIDILPGPSARGVLTTGKFGLRESILSTRHPFTSFEVSQYLATFSDEFILEGDLVVPAQDIPPTVYPDNKVRVNFWSVASVSARDYGTPLETVLKNSEYSVGLFKWDGSEVSAEAFGFTLSNSQLTYQPNFAFENLGVSMKGQMKEKVVVKTFGVAPLKTPFGGILVTTSYSSKGLRSMTTRGGGKKFLPVGEEASTMFFNGAGVGEGQGYVSTSEKYRKVLEPAFGQSGGGRELYSGKSRFCEGLFAGETTTPAASQQTWYDRFETADGDALLLRMEILKVNVSLSLSKSQLKSDGDAPTIANLMFYVCPSAAQ